MQRTEPAGKVPVVQERRSAGSATDRHYVLRRRVRVFEAWQRIPVPGICERMIGFSVPQQDTVLVVSYEGTHLVHLGPPATVETDDAYGEYDLYLPEAGICRYGDRDWEIIGLHPGRPLLTSP